MERFDSRSHEGAEATSKFNTKNDEVELRGTRYEADIAVEALQLLKHEYEKQEILGKKAMLGKLGLERYEEKKQTLDQMLISIESPNYARSEGEQSSASETNSEAELFENDAAHWAENPIVEDLKRSESEE